MKIEQILKEVNEIFIEVLENDDIILDLDTTADDIEDWDSLTHIQLIVAIEKHFGIRFNSQEIRNWPNVGAMCEAISEKIK